MNPPPENFCLLLIMLLICATKVAVARQEYCDACYRKLKMFNGAYDCSRAAIYIGMDSTGQQWILEQGGKSGETIQTAWFSDMTDYYYHGSYTSSIINPSFSIRRKSEETLNLG